MPSLEQIFAKEFKNMCQQRVAITGTFALEQLAVPKFSSGIDKKRRILIKGIEDEYYSKLNNEECIYWARPNLKRRKFGAGGKYLKDKAGNYILEDVPLTQGCVAVISKRKVGVPLKHKPTKGFQYVDCVVKRNDEGEIIDCCYIYIIPKEHCFMLNQCALVLSLNRLRSYYTGLSVVLQSGHTIYVHVIPYNPLREQQSYRVLASKTSCNFKEDIEKLIAFWQSMGMAFSYNDTMLTEPVNGTLNVAYTEYCTTQDEFVRFDPNKSMNVTSDEITDADMF